MARHAMSATKAGATTRSAPADATHAKAARHDTLARVSASPGWMIAMMDAARSAATPRRPLTAP